MCVLMVSQPLNVLNDRLVRQPVIIATTNTTDREQLFGNISNDTRLIMKLLLLKYFYFTLTRDRKSYRQMYSYTFI